MISYISGKILTSTLGKVSYVDILTSVGIGYRVFVTSRFNLSNDGEDISVYTSFQVREESQTLYGFVTQEERDFFEKLLTVSSIGPRTALSILSTYSMERVIEIVQDSDSKLLSKAPGLGLKGSQKVILELRGKIDFDKESEVDVTDAKIKELKEALKALGYKGGDLENSVKRAGELLKKDDLAIEDLVKKVLQQ